MTKVTKNKNVSLVDKFSQSELEFTNAHTLKQGMFDLNSSSSTKNNLNKETELEIKALLLADQEQEIQIKTQDIKEKIKSLDCKELEIEEIERSICDKEEQLLLKEQSLLIKEQRLLIKEGQLQRQAPPLPKAFSPFGTYAEKRVKLDKIFIDNKFEMSDELAKRINLSLSVAVEFAAVNLDSIIEEVEVKFESASRFSIQIDIKKSWSYIMKVSPTGDFLLQKFNQAVQTWNAEYSLLSRELTKNHVHGYLFTFNFDHVQLSNRSRLKKTLSSKKAIRINKSSQYDI